MFKYLIVAFLVGVLNAENQEWINVFEMVDENQTAHTVSSDWTFPHNEACKRELHFIIRALTEPLMSAECERPGPRRAENFKLDVERVNLALQILNRSSGEGNDSLLNALSQVRALSEGFLMRTQRTAGRTSDGPLSGFGRFKPSEEVLSNLFLLGSIGLISLLLVWLASTVGTRKLFNRFLLVTFVSGVVWNWYNLYLKAIARRRADLIRTAGHAACMQNGGFFATIYNAARGLFVSDNLECQRYYEAILVAPITEVSPTEALSITVVKFFVEPAQLLGEAVAKLIAGSRRDVPTLLQPFSVAVALILVLFMLTLLLGFSISTPILSINRPQRRSSLGSRRRIPVRELKMIRHNHIRRRQLLQRRPRHTNDETSDHSLYSD